MEGLGLLAGYAIGIVQILAIDWWRRRLAHAAQLRLLNAELQRLSGFGSTFLAHPDGRPKGDSIPRSSTPTELFLRAIGETDFSLRLSHPSGCSFTFERNS